MKLGVFGLTPPAAVDPDRSLEWAIDEAAKLDVEVVGGDPRPTFRWGALSVDPGYWRELKAKAAANGLEIEPFVRSPFDLVAGGPPARTELERSIVAAKLLGGPVLRTAYGDQTIQTTRFAARPLDEHLQYLAANLRAAVPVAEAHGVVLAIENHTDFSGPEWDRVLGELDSPQIRCAFDSGNGLTIFCDPLRDVDALGRWAVTTHIKDMRVIENPRPAQGFSPVVPFGLVGCLIGRGNVDVHRIIRTLLRESPLGSDIPLIVEPSWPATKSGDDLAGKRNELVALNVQALKEIVRSL